MQRSVLAQLLGETVAQRLLNNEAKVDDPKQALRLSELYATLHGAVWSELAAKTPKDIPLMRRNLQREYVLRVANVLLRPAGALPADARALLRADATKLRARDRAGARTQGAVARSEGAPGRDRSRMLDEALKAPLVRAGRYESRR